MQESKGPEGVTRGKNKYDGMNACMDHLGLDITTTAYSKGLSGLDWAIWGENKRGGHTDMHY